MSKSTALMAINWLGGSLSRRGISNQESRIFLTGFHVSGKTPAFQLATLHIAKETLFIDLTFARMETVERIVLSQWQWSLLDDMNVCSLFGTGDLLWIGLLNECLINWQEWQDIEFGQVFMLPAWEELFNALLNLAPNRMRQREPW